ncbi:MAG: hypothetical protein ACRCSX_07290 [Allorhizobium sp.]
MTAISLFDKQSARSRAASQPPVTDAQQLDEWLKRGRSEVFTVATMVSPDMARLLLSHNDANRNLNWTGATRSVAAYASAMKRGEWVLNGEPLIISRCGQLNDGQHRLHGIIQAQGAVQMLLTFGVDRGTRHTVDQGVARSPGQILTMAGEVNTNALAGTLQFLWALDNGLSFNNRFSTDQMLETLERHPEARAAILAVRGLTSHYRLSHGYIAGAYYLCRVQNQFQADHYQKALATGLNIQHANSPVSRLRAMFEDHRAQLKGKKLDRDFQAAIYIKGFNNFMKGRTGVLLWRNTGPGAEAFPVVGG